MSHWKTCLKSPENSSSSAFPQNIPDISSPHRISPADGEDSEDNESEEETTEESKENPEEELQIGIEDDDL